MSISQSFQPRREFMDISNDLNGDGIPDGAEVNVRKTATNPDTGHTTVTSARWTKKTPEERRPMEPMPQQPDTGLPPAPAPVPADQQMPTGAPGPQGGSAWDQFKRRDARASDLMFGPGRRTNTDVIPENKADTRSFLVNKASDMSVAPQVRQQAERRLAMMDEQAGRSADLASGERRTLYTAHGEQAKATAVAQAKVNAAQVTADGQRDVAATKGQTAQAVQEAKAKRDMIVQELKNSGQITIANTYAMAGRDKSELAAETDIAVAELNRQGKVEYARLLANAKGSIAPDLFVNSTDAQKDELIKILKTKSENSVATENQQDQVRRNTILENSRRGNQTGENNQSSAAPQHGPAISRKKGSNGKMMMRDASGNVWEE
jgi:hypothetical protein